MATLELQGLTKRFGEFTAVDSMNLKAAEGEMIALLGGSGCGKTTTLRMIAGFTEPTAGQILVDGKNVSTIPPYRRNIGIFFQNYALFPHMTVFENVAFGLKLQKLPKNEIRERVEHMLALVKLTGMDKRYPRQLSGGQQQRVALARALVTRPSILLLDEPLSNLDAKLRVEMQVEIKRIQKELGITTIIVTHDHEEAVSLADRVIVMNAGHILQIGKPQEVFDRPASPFIADFMGFSTFLHGIAAGTEGRYAPDPLRCPHPPGPGRIRPGTGRGGCLHSGHPL
ncbi:MAG: ABC transporter ATP-binding protein [Dysosmobacter sp.]